jgi:hypothetical protein
MSSAPTAEEIARDATWLAQALDPSAGVARLIAMDRDSYRAASFLDDRIMQTPVDAQLVSWTLVEQAITDDLRSDARWIFHIGHVGSTLLSRLIGELDGVLAVREPRLLRDVALMPGDIRERYLAPVPRLMSRTFDEREIACVKATSFVSEIAAELVPPRGRVLFMYATPRNYVASILAGENSVRELHALGPSRAARLRQQGIELGPSSTDGALAAAAWACEMASLEAASEKLTDHDVAWMDFDSALEDLANALADAVEIFGFDATPERIREVAKGPLTRRYSKAVQYEYGAELRRELIAEATAANRAAIDDALAMLARAAEKSPLLARALARSEEG